jgi:hypothetical protein
MKRLRSLSEKVVLKRAAAATRGERKARQAAEEEGPGFQIHTETELKRKNRRAPKPLGEAVAINKTDIQR